MNKKIYIIAGLLILMFAATASAHTGFFHKKRLKGWEGGFEAMIEKKAEILGISVEELKLKMLEPKSHKKSFEGKDISKEEMNEMMQEKIRLLVEEGKMTQEEADKKLEFMAQGKMYKSYFHWK